MSYISVRISDKSERIIAIKKFEYSIDILYRDFWTHSNSEIILNVNFKYELTN
jgi:hypothetical protein